MDEENRMAKLDALRDDEGNGDEDAPPSAPVSSAFTSINGRSSSAKTKSILAHGGPGRRKIKIMSGNKRKV